MRSAADTELPLRKPEDSDLSAVKTLRKALTILVAFAGAERPLTVAEVAIMTGHHPADGASPRADARRRGLSLAGCARTAGISPGYSVLQLAGRLLDSNRLRLEALPHLESLARSCGERSNLGILHRGQLLFLAGVEKPSLPTIYSRFGKTAPAYCVSLGKAILAELPQARARRISRRPAAARRTPNTITQQSALRKELAKIKRQGYAVDREEYIDGNVLRGGGDPGRREPRRRDRADRALARWADGSMSTRSGIRPR